MNPGRFDPIPIRLDCFRQGHFGPIAGVSHFGPVGAGHFGLFFKGGLFLPDFRGESFRPHLFYF